MVSETIPWECQSVTFFPVGSVRSDVQTFLDQKVEHCLYMSVYVNTMTSCINKDGNSHHNMKLNIYLPSFIPMVTDVVKTNTRKINMIARAQMKGKYRHISKQFMWYPTSVPVHCVGMVCQLLDGKYITKEWIPTDLRSTEVLEGFIENWSRTLSSRSISLFYIFYRSRPWHHVKLETKQGL